MVKFQNINLHSTLIYVIDKMWIKNCHNEFSNISEAQWTGGGVSNSPHGGAVTVFCCEGNNAKKNFERGKFKTQRFWTEIYTKQWNKLLKRNENDHFLIFFNPECKVCFIYYTFPSKAFSFGLFNVVVLLFNVSYESCQP